MSQIVTIWCTARHVTTDQVCDIPGKVKHLAYSKRCILCVNSVDNHQYPPEPDFDKIMNTREAKNSENVEL